MKTRFVAILALIAVPFFAACGGNVCDDAADACGVSEGEGEGEDVECSGTVECQAQCIVDFDCDLESTEMAECIAGC